MSGRRGAHAGKDEDLDLAQFVVTGGLVVQTDPRDGRYQRRDHNAAS
jgi:hypothetical protein